MNYFISPIIPSSDSSERSSFLEVSFGDNGLLKLGSLVFQNYYTNTIRISLQEESPSHEVKSKVLLDHYPIMQVSSILQNFWWKFEFLVSLFYWRRWRLDWDSNLPLWPYQLCEQPQSSLRPQNLHVPAVYHVDIIWDQECSVHTS